MFYGFGQTAQQELEEILKASCPPKEEEKASIWEAKLAGFPVLLWILLGGAFLYFLSKKEPIEMKEVSESVSR